MATATLSPICPPFLGPAELERLNSRGELATAWGTQSEAAKLITMTKEMSASFR